MLYAITVGGVLLIVALVTIIVIFVGNNNSENENINKDNNNKDNNNKDNNNKDNDFKTKTMTNYYMNNINSRNSKSRNNISELSTLKTFCNKYTSNTSDNYHIITFKYNSPRNQQNRTFYKTFFKKRKKKEKKNNFFYKEKEKDKINNGKKAEKITNELLSLKTKKDIERYYIKKDHAQAVMDAEKEENNNINKCLDPKTYIKYNLTHEPKNYNLFKSFDIQLMIMGNQKYRNDLLNGVNLYKYKKMKYDDLRGPIGFDKEKIEEKERYKTLEKMKMNYLNKKGLIFANKLYKNTIKRKFFHFEFDENYKNVKKLLYDNRNKYQSRIKKTKNDKKIDDDINNNDIETLRKMDSDAKYVITDKDEMTKYINKLLSFDNKMDKIILSTRNTTDYLSLRAQEHRQIKKKMDKI